MNTGELHKQEAEARGSLTFLRDPISVHNAATDPLHFCEIARTAGLTVARVRAETNRHGSGLRTGDADVFYRWVAESGFKQ